MNWIRESNLIEDVDDPYEDERCIVAWKESLRHTELTNQLILQTHFIIMRKHLPLHAGKFRNCAVSVGGRQCPSPRSIKFRLKDWIRDFHDARTEEDIKKAHIKFEHIHPFVDGNGRTGRMIMNWMRVRAGFEPLCIKAAERQSYYDWFRKPGKQGGRDELELLMLVRRLRKRDPLP